MRVRGAALAAVLLGSVLATGVAVSAPAGGATNPTVTIRALDRAGKPVAVTASLQSPVSSPTGIDETLTSKHPTRVRPGTYNIAAWVNEPDGSAQTLVDRVLTVKTSVTVTFDARKGHRIQFVVNDATVAQRSVLAEPYSPHGWDAFDGWSAASTPAVYAVPGTMAAGYILSLEADLVRPNEFLSPVEYILVKQIKHVIPSNLTFRVNKADLATDHVTVKAIDPGKPGGVAFQPLVNKFPGTLPATLFGQWAYPPFSIDFHFTPGYSWESQTLSGTDNLNNVSVLGVRHYSQTFDNATFGPSPQFGPFVSGNQVQTNWGGYLFVDPTQDLTVSNGMQATGQVWLYEGTKLLQHRVNAPLSATIPAALHWYTLRVQGIRGPGATLWKSMTWAFNFPARDNAINPDVFVPRIIPAGLSLRNAAAHGTRTAVRVYFDDLSPSMAVHGVRVWASVNGGKTWQALHVTPSGPHWTAIVTNPAKAGYVSLRVQGTNAVGATSRVTTINAYAVS